MKKIKKRDESNWKNYLIKAKEFFETARDAYLKENWNSTGLNSVHCAISANDALTIYYGKVRSISEKHSDAVELLLGVFPEKEEAIKFSKHLLWLINKKNLIEYESRLFFSKEAKEALKHSERFLYWAESKLPN